MQVSARRRKFILRVYKIMKLAERKRSVEFAKFAFNSYNLSVDKIQKVTLDWRAKEAWKSFGWRVIFKKANLHSSRVSSPTLASPAVGGVLREVEGQIIGGSGCYICMMSADCRQTARADICIGSVHLSACLLLSALLIPYRLV